MKLFTGIDINDPEWEGEDVRLKNRSDAKKNIIDYLDTKVIGQLPVKIAIVKALENSANILIDRKGPIAKFLFYGPSGTGKTSIVQELAGMLFNDNKGYTHISCENLNASHQTANLFGSPPGYVGFQKKTMLSPEMVYGPYNRAKAQKQLPLPSVDSIILFDEVEKMHPTISQSLLSVLDEGIVNLMDGTKTDLSRAMIFFTSNIGEKEINSRKPIGFVEQEFHKEQVREQAIRKHFSPEFMARIDDMFEFETLGGDDRMKILKEVMTSKLKDDILYYTPGITISIGDDVYDNLIEKSKDKTVRELKRGFEEIRLRLGMIIVTNNLEDKNLHIKIKMEGEKIIYVFNK